MLRAFGAGRRGLFHLGRASDCVQRCESCTLVDGSLMVCKNQHWKDSAVACAHLVVHSIDGLKSHVLLAALLAPELCYTMSRTGLENSLEGVIRAMRRRDVLQRADEMIAHSIGRVLLALATTVADKDKGCKSVSCLA
jgi:hypothetical protein